MGILSTLGKLADAGIKKLNDPEFQKSCGEFMQKQEEVNREREGARKKQAEQDRNNRYKSLKRINENFAWIETPSEKNGEIVGKIINISEENYTYVSVKFSLNDSSKSKVDTSEAHITTLQPGQVWSFRSPIYCQDATSFNFVRITAW